MLNRRLAFAGALPRDARDTLFLLSVIAWVLLPQTGNLPLWCSSLAGIVLVWRGWLALKSRPLPNRWWLIALLGVTIAATFFTYRSLLGRDAGVTLLVVLLSLKTLELRVRRDAFVVFFLGFFCMLSNFFYSQSLLTAFSMLVGLMGLLTVLVNAHMPVGKPPLLVAARTAGGMALLGAPIMLMLFMLFPRMAPLWGVPSDAMTGRSGLSGSMQVGNIASLALDDSVAMRIKFDGAPPPPRDLYFRGPVLSNFDGREWKSSSTDYSGRRPAQAALSVSGPAIDYEVTLEPTRRPWLLTLEAVAEAPDLPGYQTAMQPDLQWLTNRPINDQLSYKARSFPSFRYGPVRDEVALRDYVDLPPGFNPRTLTLAAQMRRDPRYAQASNAELVRVVLERLRTGGFTYTLEPGVYGQNTADEFWFDRKEGFCEHIASSFVILMRGLDVPARIVTGYQGGELNNVDGFWVVRQSDAHAWAEVWQPGLGWIRVDPTSAVSPGRTGAFQRLAAPQGVMAQTLGTFSPTLVAQIRAVWEATNNAWSQWVLNYTQGNQLNLLRNIGFESPSWTDLSSVLIGIVVIAAVVGAVWTLWDRTQHDPWLRLLARARKRLDKAGVHSTPATSPRQLAKLVMAAYGTRGQGLHDWLMQLESVRYAGNSGQFGGPASGKGLPAPLQRLRLQFGKLAWPV